MIFASSTPKARGATALLTALATLALSAITQAAPVKTFVKESGPLKVTAYYKEADILSDTDDDALDYTPSVAVSLSGRAVAMVKLEGAIGKPRVYVVEMDPANNFPEVVVEGYTGGAHCCTQIQVVTARPGKAGDAWDIVDLGEYDGSWREPRDIDADGLKELSLRDDRFLYAYGCYACSYAPPKIVAVRGGKERDLTRTKSMRPVLVRVARELEGRMRKSLKPGGEGNDGILAGYVALKIMIGEALDGWKRMLRLHERRKRYAYCPMPISKGPECPVREEKLRFPLHLSIFLRELGYISGD